MADQTQVILAVIALLTAIISLASQYIHWQETRDLRAKVAANSVNLGKIIQANGLKEQ